MAKSTTKITADNLGMRLAERRSELGLSIEEASVRARVTASTWKKYEAESYIGKYNYEKVLRALKWKDLFDPYPEIDRDSLDIDFPDANHPYWVQALEYSYGDLTAAYFALGAEAVKAGLESDMRQMRKLPCGAHIGQLSRSFIEQYLPGRYTTQYSYEFLHDLLCALDRLKYSVCSRYYSENTIADMVLVVAICSEADALFEENGIPSIKSECPEGLPRVLLGIDSPDEYVLNIRQGASHQLEDWFTKESCY